MNRLNLTQYEIDMLVKELLKYIDEVINKREDSIENIHNVN